MKRAVSFTVNVRRIIIRMKSAPLHNQIVPQLYITASLTSAESDDRNKHIHAVTCLKSAYGVGIAAVSFRTPAVCAYFTDFSLSGVLSIRPNPACSFVTLCGLFLSPLCAESYPDIALSTSDHARASFCSCFSFPRNVVFRYRCRNFCPACSIAHNTGIYLRSGRKQFGRLRNGRVIRLSAKFCYQLRATQRLFETAYGSCSPPEFCKQNSLWRLDASYTPCNIVIYSLSPFYRAVNYLLLVPAISSS